jgi:hypothetical protein
VVNLAATSINTQRTFDAILARGTPIERPFGTERLRIAALAINLDPMRAASSR